MSTFNLVSNPMMGKSDWNFNPEEYDYHQEIARAAFADMLHDQERNEKYLLALQKTITKLHAKGTEAHVLDIGTGTGILSMMAVQCGADSVTACEAFDPMADCAEKILEKNNMKHKIHLIKKRSNEVTVGEKGDMVRRANVLITEVFDTELIGEGAIEIFNHAHKYLLTDDCIVIPDSATIYGQVVESPLAMSWNKPKLLANLDGEVLLQTPKEIETCCGESTLHDIQLNQFSQDKFNCIAGPVEIFEYNFSSKTPIRANGRSNLKLVASSTGILQAVFFWWDIKMDQEGEIVLSCAPYWAHPDFKKLSIDNNSDKIPIQNIIPWRDHWMQAVYFIQIPLIVEKNQEFYLNSYHDEYSFWFSASKCEEELQNIDKYSCKCGYHLAFSRNRIAQLNQISRNKKYIKMLENTINKQSIVLSIGNCCLLGLSTAAMGAKNVTCLDENRFSREVLKSYSETNKLENVQIVDKIDKIENWSEFTHIFAEPYFELSILPWDNFYFGTFLSNIKSNLNENIEIIPYGARIMAIPVEFLDLHKIRSPLGICNGFDLRIFDNLIDVSSRLADAVVEPHPLWEYPCRALGEAHEVLSVNFNEYEKDFNNTGKINIEKNGMCNGIALWVEWNLDKNKTSQLTISTGPIEPIEVGNFINWDLNNKQGVHLVRKPITVDKTNKIDWKVSFKPTTGNLNFKFDIN